MRSAEYVLCQKRITRSAAAYKTTDHDLSDFSFLSQIAPHGAAPHRSVGMAIGEEMRRASEVFSKYQGLQSYRVQ